MTENKRAFLIFGDDEFEVEAAAKKVVNRFCPDEQQTYGLDVIDGRVGNSDDVVGAIDKTVLAIQAMGLFASDRVIWLRDVTFLAENHGLSDRLKGKLLQSADPLFLAEQILDTPGNR